MAKNTRLGARGLRTISNNEDEKILERSLKEPNHFKVLIERYESGFLNVALRVVKNKEDAEDVVQETFVKIYTKGHTFRKKEGATFKSWAYAILTNTAYSHWRKQRKNAIPYEEFFDTLLFDEAEQLWNKEILQREQRDELERAINTLPDGMGELVRMHYFQGRPYADIMMETGLAMGTLKTQLHRARLLLKKHFTHHESAFTTK